MAVTMTAGAAVAWLALGATVLQGRRAAAVPA
jgi:hypothetical protein